MAAAVEDSMERFDSVEWMGRETGLRFFRPYERVVDESAGIERVRWCVGGTTNAALNALDRWRGTPTWDKPAILWEGENGDRRALSRAGRTGAALRRVRPRGRRSVRGIPGVVRP